MAEWLKFDGSEEHKSMLRGAINGWACKQKNSGNEIKNLPQVKCVPFDEIDEFMIYEPNPHAEMIIEWARTGRPVYRKYQDGIWRIDPDQIWDKHEEYSFDPPREKFRYKAALMKGSEYYYIAVAYADEGVVGITRNSLFVRWLDDDWQEVEV